MFLTDYRKSELFQCAFKLRIENIMWLPAFSKVDCVNKITFNLTPTVKVETLSKTVTNKH